jgi:hypothetical protein
MDYNNYIPASILSRYQLVIEEIIFLYIFEVNMSKTYINLLLNQEKKILKKIIIVF